MGNQLAGIAPSQIFPVEHYLTDLPDIHYDCNLGSTRFFKVARARHKEGWIVVKVFAIHDPSLPLRTHRDRLEEIRSLMTCIPNCLPFQKSILTDKAAILMRQYVKDNLYDRISTRPFLNSMEKHWIAFQLLNAVNNCHKLGVCHGDIKLENIMVTGWNWVLLTDFASFKPTYLPEDNPADFSYFFDTSRRRTCYIAPERFVKTLNSDVVQSNTVSNLVLPEEEIKKGDLNAAMDIFSLGCALTELFTEGHVPFDFSQLLSYRSGEYSPWKVIEKIEDPCIRDLVRHMMQKDPNKRSAAEEYLEQQRGKAFPEYFYSFLREYVQGFASVPILTPDERIARLKPDIKKILEALTDSAKDKNDRVNDGLVIIVSLVTSCLRALKHCTAKLHALEVLKQMAELLSSEVILDRLLPYMLFLVNDRYPQVRVAAIKTMTYCLTLVKIVPRSDANIFPEYILRNVCDVYILSKLGSIVFSFNLVPVHDESFNIDLTSLQEAKTELERKIQNGELICTGVDGKRLLAVPLISTTSSPNVFASFTPVLLGIVVCTLVLILVLVILAAIVVKHITKYNCKVTPAQNESRPPSYRSNENIGSLSEKDNISKFCYDSRILLGPQSYLRRESVPSAPVYQPPTNALLNKTQRPTTALRNKLKDEWNVDTDNCSIQESPSE